jgi:hypothetical protein
MDLMADVLPNPAFAPEGIASRRAKVGLNQNRHQSGFPAGSNWVTHPATRVADCGQPRAITAEALVEIYKTRYAGPRGDGVPGTSRWPRAQASRRSCRGGRSRHPCVRGGSARHRAPKVLLVARPGSADDAERGHAVDDSDGPGLHGVDRGELRPRRHDGRCSVTCARRRATPTDQGTGSRRRYADRAGVDQRADRGDRGADGSPRGDRRLREKPIPVPRVR